MGFDGRRGDDPTCHRCFKNWIYLWRAYSNPSDLAHFFPFNEWVRLDKGGEIVLMPELCKKKLGINN
jgi:hypothetical protein